MLITVIEHVVMNKINGYIVYKFHSIHYGSGKIIYCKHDVRWEE